MNKLMIIVAAVFLGVSANIDFLPILVGESVALAASNHNHRRYYRSNHARQASPVSRNNQSAVTLVDP